MIENYELTLYLQVDAIYMQFQPTKTFVIFDELWIVAIFRKIN